MIVNLVFNRWNVVPEDPLDRKFRTRPVEMASALATVGDFVLRTRRRKRLDEKELEGG